ncbi:uncharacterized protein LOC130590287 [Beta vulgaris subsp. vulgaris]|uniref:uncharacterized protein LOC130590287 n=1 Tax=Beta vulgaris subsp. vulgaris TaxID=3555 RepID=UPI002546A643|nr:uncharacterized protein LOC130590287 [Beta vulgaris subsp. vulgaris]
MVIMIQDVINPCLRRKANLIYHQSSFHFQDLIPINRKTHLIDRICEEHAQVEEECACILSSEFGDCPDIREEGEKLSQDSISLDDSEVFNPDFLSQIDDICKRHLEAKDSANKVDPTISLLVKRPVELEFGRIENVPDLDSGVHGVDLKEGNDEKEGEEDEKKMNADDDQHKEDDDDDDGGDIRITRIIREKG